ncbi:E3 ubiquitin-protein ligase RNF34-like isoform X3 [Lineus longissimus]|uniref:E3 ubiquitin-protein ligase RNF34-like isoform X3 n=1 Tax=Lineus longissimus TaxID=88925 RepID=UPI00315D618C
MKKFAEECINQISASMGAGASTFNSSSSSLFNRSNEAVATCEACSVPFTFLKRKKLCCVCQNNYCTACVIRDQGGLRTCNKCRILSSRRLSRSELMQLKIKDLRQYLLMKNITMDGCKEKKDLVELIVKSNNGQSTVELQRQQQQAHQEWVEQLARQHQETQTSEGQGSQSSGESLEAEESPPQATQHSPSTSSEDWIPHTAEETQSAELMQTVHHDTPESNEPDQPAPPRRMTLEQLQHESDIDELSVRQLKEVLANNFVDYKGCCEKRELVERTKRLWNENQRQWQRIHSKNSRQKNRAGASSQNRRDSQKKRSFWSLIFPSSGLPSVPTPNDPGVPPPSYGEATQSDPSHSSLCNPADDDEEEDGMCKICMDAPIDCVLLECGHFVACTKCGKRLSECPICRQYVVRAVHIFRA